MSEKRIEQLKSRGIPEDEARTIERIERDGMTDSLHFEKAGISYDNFRRR